MGLRRVHTNLRSLVELRGPNPGTKDMVKAMYTKWCALARDGVAPHLSCDECTVAGAITALLAARSCPSLKEQRARSGRWRLQFAAVDSFCPSSVTLQ